jgi:biopolymer transport protein ExbD
MSTGFDPYYEWLGIPRKDQPPNHYRLLGIELFEENPNVIERSADRQMVHLRTFQTSKYASESQKLLNEVAAARVCLLSPEEKVAYDRSLKDELSKAAPPPLTPRRRVRQKPPAPPEIQPKQRSPQRVAAGAMAPPPIAAAAVIAIEPDETEREPPVRFDKGRSREETEMDMTPMVDVTFLLLIFFMVTASFSLQKAIPEPAPEESEPSAQVRTIEDFQDNPEYVTVRVDQYNTFRVITTDWEKDAPSEQDLLIKLRDARQGNSAGIIPTRLLVIANGEALHETVIRALDAGTAVGMQEVQLLTVEEDEL